jgi:hypothetical protein
VTAVTFLRRPDELLDRMVESGGKDCWPGRAVDPGDSDGVITRAPHPPKTPIETLVYRRP